MKHWALIENDTVINVTVSVDDAIDGKWLSDNVGGVWVEAGVDSGVSIGHTYKADLDLFIPPKPTEDATLDETTFSWIVPEVEDVEAE